MLVAIEGADGAGKNTTATRLCETLNEEGVRATVLAFPRYGQTVGGVTIGRYLAGELPVPVSIEAAAVLYALDRLESRAVIEQARDAHDVVIFDRYTASNMAYQAAKTDPGHARAMMEWIATLESVQFSLPRPDFSIYLDTPWDMARRLILQKRKRSYTDRAFDEHEADVQLQLRVRDAYETMVSADILGPWRTVQTVADGTMRAPDEIVADIRSFLRT